MKTYKHRITDEILKRKLLGKGAVLVLGPKCKSKFFCNNFRKLYNQHISATWILPLVAVFLYAFG